MACILMVSSSCHIQFKSFVKFSIFRVKVPKFFHDSLHIYPTRHSKVVTVALIWRRPPENLNWRSFLRIDHLLFPHLGHVEPDHLLRPGWKDKGLLYRTHGKYYDWSHSYTIHMFAENKFKVPKNPAQLKGYDNTLGQVNLHTISPFWLHIFKILAFLSGKVTTSIYFLNDIGLVWRSYMDE